MIVLGRRRVEFVVTQFVNGLEEDDCQEVVVEGVEIRLEGLPESVIDVGGGDVWVSLERNASVANVRRDVHDRDVVGEMAGS